ncbi:folate-dependent protein for Fe/S cluster synthesis [Vibrio ishigakensis]|uniref:Folate-dependent protein for Fe/S cluster synthesis n=1 Tax=Vibrio ishigakensis TaxID=1481914 RepID=A0A0B8NRG6_9VIBR|nr:tRNA-modifying protein YgfZ [Vibrio ishigakensis]GAM57170.1 folate-dependent protein for Fe/S cluster synthesis [Vibrio ishigakensis]
MNLPALAWTELNQWKAITVTGDDKKSYLQGQVTCDLVTLDLGSSTLGAHCDAKGKMWSIFRLFNHAEGYALWQPASGIDTAFTELKKYSVFSKVEMNISDAVSLGVLGEKAETFIDTLSESRDSVRAIEGGSAVKVDDQRWLLLVDSNTAEQLKAKLTDTEQLDAGIWDGLDIAQGIPRIEAKDQSQHIPQNLNLQALGGVSFEKGCYTGQETVARAKYRGMNKRVMRIISGTAQGDSFEFERQVGENWRGAGEALAHYVAEDGTAMALIVVNKDLEDETKLRLKEAPENIWKLEPLPYALDD